ncbi:MAG: multidrug efflux SMR transporter [Planctomycetia bacterium]|nr:multidrug efflux SMR transporter [Planctomycetia bacterium]
MGWLYLLLAGLLEIGWPTGLKMAQVSPSKWGWILFAVFTMGASGVLLYLAQRHIPIGTAYAVWTGIGAAGTFCVGVLFFRDTAGLMQYLGVALIIAGVVMLKIGHG